MPKEKTKTQKIKSYRFGIIAEFLAIAFLFLKGYRILERRYKTKLGEIDIVALKGNTIVAIEVKARRKVMFKNGFLFEEVLSENQKRRIKRAAMFFMKRNFKKYKFHSIRFDLVVVSPYKMPLHLVGFWE
ncbi:MAG: putative endonuclease [Rickettsiales bacterium]|jgi:putative endonuclease